MFKSSKDRGATLKAVVWGGGGWGGGVTSDSELGGRLTSDSEWGWGGRG